METVYCNCCGARRQRLIYLRPDDKYFPDEFFRVVECGGCGLGFVNPRPTIEEMPKFYPGSFYDYFEGQSDFHLKRYALEAQYFSDSPGTSTGKLLDVGCANGGFPRFMRGLGWNVEGVEIPATAKKITDFPVFSEKLHKIPVFGPTYDAISAWAVLEHVHDPMSYFEKA